LGNALVGIGSLLLQFLSPLKFWKPQTRTGMATPKIEDDRRSLLS
jgi:hypothetical protein